MAIAKVIEISAQSPDSFEAAIRDGLAKASKSIRHIEGAWIKEQKVVVDEGKITSFRVDMKVTFVLDE